MLDFGLARTEDAQQLTQTATQIGSLPYLPPEQLDPRMTDADFREQDPWWVVSKGGAFNRAGAETQSAFRARDPADGSRGLLSLFVFCLGFA